MLGGVPTTYAALLDAVRGEEAGDARLGAGLRGLRPVSVVCHPGVEPREALPATLDALLTAQAIAVRAAAAEGPLVSGWKPAPLACPTLYVRAREPLPGAEPAPDWSLPHAEVIVDGDHFTMLEEHAVPPHSPFTSG
ncbi:hypothetical protein ACWGMA_27995 [Streptomyces asiaticus]